MTQLPASVHLFFGTGRKIDIFNFTRKELNPLLLGRSLSRIARYSGNGNRSVSVAQHSANLARYLKQLGRPIEEQRAAILHDTPEVFTGDVPTPVKRLCPDLLAIDAKIVERLSVVFDVPMAAFDAIHEFDKRISKDEALFMFDRLDDWGRDLIASGGGPLGVKVINLSDAEAAYLFTSTMYDLFPEGE